MKNYKFFLILAVALMARMYNIHAPILSWRPADTMAIAINFHENGYNLFYPQVDWGGDTPGYVESEFPIYSYLSALIFGLLGVSELYARLLSITISLIGIVFFYLLVREITDEKAALWSSIFISILPLNVAMGRMIMPESLLMTSLILGVYFFSKWLSSNRWTHFILSAGFTSLACLIKIPSLYMGLPILYLAWLKFGRGIFFQYKLWIFALIVLGSTAAWYYHAHQLYSQSDLTFGIWGYGTDKWGNWALILTGAFWRTIWLDHLGELFFVWFGYPIFIASLFLKRYTPQEKVFDYWIVSILIYFIIVGRGNLVHDYYQLPFTIPAAVFLGKVYARYFNRDNPALYASLFLIFCAVCVTSAYNYNRFYLQYEDPKKSEEYELAQHILQNTEEDALMIILDNGDPTTLYLSNRKGWHAFAGSEMLENLSLDERIENGAQYLAGKYQSCSNEAQCIEFEKLLEQYELVFKNKKYFIANLSN